MFLKVCQIAFVSINFMLDGKQIKFQFKILLSLE